MHKTEFFRTEYRALWIWPAIAIVLSTALWAFTLSKNRQEEAEARYTAFLRAQSITAAYAEQIGETVERIDQATRLVSRDWEEGRLQLEEYAEQGIFPSSDFHVTAANRHGDVLSTTLPPARSVNYGGTAWYQYHRIHRADTLLFLGEELSMATGKHVIRFSRRLNRSDGSFGGVTWVTVEPPLLTTFFEGSRLAAGEFISLRRLNGPVLATRLGGGETDIRIFYKKSPQFRGEEGIEEEPAGKFHDGQARIVAWKKIDPYPLVALTAFTEQEAYAASRASAGQARKLALLGTLLLLGVAAVVSYYAVRLAQRNRRDAETRNIFRLAVDGAREGFYMVRPLYKAGRLADFRIADCNERGAALMGRRKEELVNRKYRELYAGEQLEMEFAFFRHGLEEGFYEDEIRVPADSAIKAVWVQRRLVRSGSGLAMTIRDISDTKAHERALIAIANADALTGLPNRHWLHNYLPTAVDHARTYHIGMAILFIDLDNFKNINDTLGHAAGDELLKAAARRLKSLVRAGDHVVRLGGDEFTIVLEQIQRLEDASHIAALIVEALGKPFMLAGSAGHHVHASIGISLFPQDGADSETLLKHADIAMYAAKAAGKGRYHFYQSHLSDHLVLRVNREAALRCAIERDEFVLHYQPRVDTLTGRICSMEALVRWMHPERGLVPPIEFIQVAEDAGLILRIGEQVIAKACAQLAIWKAQGLPLLPISINVSALQFNDGKVKETLAGCIRRYGIDPALIGIELTESCMVADNTAVPEQLNAIRGLGVKLLIDDFGTGYSSLSQLQKLDVDVLKVDRAFTMQLSESEEGKAFFKAIVSMAEALGMCIVAEGVETVEQLRILQDLSCDEVQGYFISAPVPAEEVPSLMTQRCLFPRFAVADQAS